MRMNASLAGLLLMLAMVITRLLEVSVFGLSTAFLTGLFAVLTIGVPLFVVAVARWKATLL